MNKPFTYQNVMEHLGEINKSSFLDAALAVFRFQYTHNTVYNGYCKALKCNADEVKTLKDIPFLPISFFKKHIVTTRASAPAFYFESSGTTQTINSKHYVTDIGLYKKSYTQGFARFYGNPEQYCILGLLPSYLERQNSSLVMMVDGLIKQSKHPDSGFYLYNQEELSRLLIQLESQEQPVLLIGVTFALLDFAENFPMPLKHTIVMETGGMKGRKKEMVRGEVQDVLKTAFQLTEIHSEYGMTELLSQAYSKREGIFECPPWMKVELRKEDDPLTLVDAANTPKTGIINVVDLANIYSCSFIATDDAGKLYPDGSFEVLGRTDNSDIRGCSLMHI